MGLLIVFGAGLFLGFVFGHDFAWLKIRRRINEVIHDCEEAERHCLAVLTALRSSEGHSPEVLQ